MGAIGCKALIGGDDLAFVDALTIRVYYSIISACIYFSVTPLSSAMFFTSADIGYDCSGWTRPWSFVEELQTWLRRVDKWAKGDGTRELQIVLREENCERREYYRQSFAYGPFTHYVGRQEQSYWQHYTEPSADPLPATNTALSKYFISLRSETLTHNSAVVVCAKVDQIDEGHDIAAGASSIYHASSEDVCLKCQWI